MQGFLKSVAVGVTVVVVSHLIIQQLSKRGYV